MSGLGARLQAATEMLRWLLTKQRATGQKLENPSAIVNLQPMTNVPKQSKQNQKVIDKNGKTRLFLKKTAGQQVEDMMSHLIKTETKISPKSLPAGSTSGPGARQLVATEMLKRL